MKIVDVIGDGNCGLYSTVQGILFKHLTGQISNAQYGFLLPFIEDVFTKNKKYLNAEVSQAEDADAVKAKKLFDAFIAQTEAEDSANKGSDVVWRKRQLLMKSSLRYMLAEELNQFFPALEGIEPDEMAAVQYSDCYWDTIYNRLLEKSSIPEKDKLELYRGGQSQASELKNWDQQHNNKQLEYLLDNHIQSISDSLEKEITLVKSIKELNEKFDFIKNKCIANENDFLGFITNKLNTWMQHYKNFVRQSNHFAMWYELDWLVRKLGFNVTNNLAEPYHRLVYTATNEDELAGMQSDPSNIPKEQLRIFHAGAEKGMHYQTIIDDRTYNLLAVGGYILTSEEQAIKSLEKEIFNRVPDEIRHQAIKNILQRKNFYGDKTKYLDLVENTIFRMYKPIELYKLSDDELLARKLQDAEVKNFLKKNKKLIKQEIAKFKTPKSKL